MTGWLHGRMGTIWLKGGGAECLICPTFYMDKTTVIITVIFEFGRAVGLLPT